MRIEVTWNRLYCETYMKCCGRYIVHDYTGNLFKHSSKDLWGSNLSPNLLQAEQSTSSAWLNFEFDWLSVYRNFKCYVKESKFSFISFVELDFCQILLSQQHVQVGNCLEFRIWTNRALWEKKLYFTFCNIFWYMWFSWDSGVSTSCS